MTETRFQVLRVAGVAVAFLAAVGLQAWRPHRRLAGHWRGNGALWAVDVAVVGLACAGCGWAVARWAEEGGRGLLHLAAAPPWAALVVTVLALDLVSYGWHRANHTLPFLWRFHQAHHSDGDFTVTTALRFHPGELLMALPLRLGAVAALGAPVEGVLVFEVLFALANFWEHGDIELPPRLEAALTAVVITPALHRRHHGRRRHLMDSNYGTILSVWDRALGTHGPCRSDERVVTGLPGLDHTPGPGEALAMPLRRPYAPRGRRDAPGAPDQRT